MPQFEQSNDFTERITNRNLNQTCEQTIASSALLRIMQESDSLYNHPARVEWTQKKIDVFKDNLRAQITHKKLDAKSNSSMHWPDEYAKMLRKELEYIETCIEYNDKTGHIPTEANLSKPLELTKAERIKNKFDKGSKTKIVGRIDLNTPDSKPEWDEE